MHWFIGIALPDAMPLTSPGPARWGRSVLAVGVLLGAVGCQQRVASKLLGEWEGRPDTASARAERDLQRFGAGLQLSAEGSIPPAKGSVAAADGSVASIQGGSPNLANASVRTTDWENYDVTVSMNFVSSEHLELSLAGGTQPVSGRWQIVSTSPAGCTIDVLTQPDGAEGESEEVVRRRFELLLDQREGNCVGFLLTEAGADPQQGAIYFQRPQRSGVAPLNE